MSRKPFVMLLTGLILGGVLNSGLFDEAKEAQLSKAAWIASATK